MLTASAVVDALRVLSAPDGGSPQTADLAARLGVDVRHVRRVVAELVSAGVVRRVGAGPQTRLVVAVQAPRIDALRALVDAARARAPHSEIERLALAALAAGGAA